VDYFKKVDAGFRERNYMKAELLSAYKYLTQYFATLNNQELRLSYLKKHIEAIVDKPGKLTHLRRMKLTRVNELPRFDLSLG